MSKDQDLIATFLAKRGATRVAEGAGNGMSTRDWYKAVRGEYQAHDLTQVRRVAAINHLGQEVIVNGLGELIAVE